MRCALCALLLLTPLLFHFSCREACPLLLARLASAQLVDSTSYAANSRHGSARRLQASILQCLAEVWEPLQPEAALVSQVATACLPYLHRDAPEELAVWSW
jgi:hypothetical protein